MLKAKMAYEKPILRKVRLAVETSVLATCYTSTSLTPTRAGGKGACKLFPKCYS